MDTKDAAYEALHDTVTDLMVEFSALARRVDDVDDTLAEKIIGLQNRVDKLETK